MSYSPTGPFQSGGEPGIDHTFLNEVERSLLEDFVLRVAGVIRGYREPLAQLPSSGTVVLDLAEHNVFRVDPTATVDVTFDSLPGAGEAASATLIVEHSDYSVTFPAGTKYPDGEPPELDGRTYLSILAEGDGTVVVALAFGGVA